MEPFLGLLLLDPRLRPQISRMSNPPARTPARPHARQKKENKDFQRVGTGSLGSAAHIKETVCSSGEFRPKVFGKQFAMTVTK